MIEPRIALHAPNGAVLMVRVERIGERQPASTLDDPRAKTVLIIDGRRQGVCESEAEIEALIKALP